MDHRLHAWAVFGSVFLFLATLSWTAAEGAEAIILTPGKTKGLRINVSGPPEKPALGTRFTERRVTAARIEPIGEGVTSYELRGMSPPVITSNALRLEANAEAGGRHYRLFVSSQHTLKEFKKVGRRGPEWALVNTQNREQSYEVFVALEKELPLVLVPVGGLTRIVLPNGVSDVRFLKKNDPVSEVDVKTDIRMGFRGVRAGKQTYRFRYKLGKETRRCAVPVRVLAAEDQSFVLSADVEPYEHQHEVTVEQLDELFGLRAGRIVAVIDSAGASVDVSDDVVRVWEISKSVKVALLYEGVEKKSLRPRRRVAEVTLDLHVPEIRVGRDVVRALNSTKKNAIELLATLKNAGEEFEKIQESYDKLVEEQDEMQASVLELEGGRESESDEAAVEATGPVDSTGVGAAPLVPTSGDGGESSSEVAGAAAASASNSTDVVTDAMREDFVDEINELRSNLDTYAEELREFSLAAKRGRTTLRELDEHVAVVDALITKIGERILSPVDDPEKPVRGQLRDFVHTLRSHENYGSQVDSVVFQLTSFHNDLKSAEAKIRKSDNAVRAKMLKLQRKERESTERRGRVDAIVSTLRRRMPALSTRANLPLVSVELAEKGSTPDKVRVRLRFPDDRAEIQEPLKRTRMTIETLEKIPSFVSSVFAVSPQLSELRVEVSVDTERRRGRAAPFIIQTFECERAEWASVSSENLDAGWRPTLRRFAISPLPKVDIGSEVEAEKGFLQRPMVVVCIVVGIALAALYVFRR